MKGDLISYFTTSANMRKATLSSCKCDVLISYTYFRDENPHVLHIE
jgi:hypothetical protein